MKDKVRIKQINEIKRTILKQLDKIGEGEVLFERLIEKVRPKKINEKILKKYIGLLYDDGLIDINSSFTKSKTKIKSSINKNTKIQILSEGQYFAYNKKDFEIETEIKVNPLKLFSFSRKKRIKQN